MNALAHKHPCLEPDCQRDFICYNAECSTAGGARICGACMFRLQRRHKNISRGATFL